MFAKDHPHNSTHAASVPLALPEAHQKAGGEWLIGHRRLALEASVALANANIAAAIDRAVGTVDPLTEELFDLAGGIASQLGATDFSWGVDVPCAHIRHNATLFSAWKLGYEDAKDRHMFELAEQRATVDWDVEFAVTELERIFGMRVRH
jgi:hypothetical protein